MDSAQEEGADRKREGGGQRLSERMRERVGDKLSERRSKRQRAGLPTLKHLV